MKALRLTFLMVLVALMTACQNKNSNSDSEDNSNAANQERLQSLKQDKGNGNIASMRAQALSILNHRLKNNPESYAIIEADTWEYEFVFDGQMSERGAFDGVWIDFKPDFTYTYGTNGKVEGSGKYSYHFDRSELLMVDNISGSKPQEWQVKSAGDAMVLIGTSLYGDNAIQMKLKRVPDSIQQQ